MRRRIAQFMLIALTTLVVWGLYARHASVAASPYSLSEPRRAASMAVFIVGLLAVAYINGLPDAVRTVRRTVTASVASPAITVVLVSIGQLAVGDRFLPRFVVFASLLAVPVVNLIVSLPLVIANQRSGVAAVVVCDEAQRADLDDTVSRAMPARLIIEDVMLATPADAARVGEALRALDPRPDIVAVADWALDDPRLATTLTEMHASGTRIRTMLGFYEEWFRQVPLSEMQDVSLLFDVSELHSPVYVRLKRVMDLSAAVALGLVLILVLPIVVIGNLIGNRGGLWFTQPRVGKGGREFKIIKLRTMSTGSSGADEWTAPDDPRVTGFGRWLRRLHIDELPQALNIMRGELSLVGPRPEQPHYVDRLRAELPYYDARLIVRPGLTGWAQVALGYTASTAGAGLKLQYELFYIRNQSIGFDFRIVMQTIRTSIRRGGR